jgi:trimeric autotransporter adhesin
MSSTDALWAELVALDTPPSSSRPATASSSSTSTSTSTPTLQPPSPASASLSSRLLSGGVRRDGARGAVPSQAMAAAARARAMHSVSGALLLGTSSSSSAPETSPPTPLASSAAAVNATSKEISNPLPPFASFSTLEAARAALARDLSAVADESPVVRLASLRRLSVCLFGRDLGDADDTARLVAVAAGGGGPGSSSSSLSLSAADAAAADSASAAAVSALSSTSHAAAVAGRALVPKDLASTVLALDPAYVYHAHELSPVAAMIMGRDADGAKVKGGVGLAAAAAAAGGGEGGAAAAAGSGGAGTTYRFSAATGMITALAAAMGTPPPLNLAGAAAAQAAAPSSSAPSAAPLPAASGADSDDEDSSANPSTALASPSTPSTLSPRQLLLALLPDLHKPLLRRFTDPSEPCRLTAVGLVTALLAHARDVSPLLPYLAPSLVDRVGGTWVFDPAQKIFARDADAADAYHRGRVLSSHQGVLAPTTDSLFTSRVAEPSEPGRLLLARLLFALVATAVREGAAAVLESYLHELIMCAHSLAVDPAPDVRVVACPALLLLSDAFPQIVKHYAVAIVRSLMVGGLDHRHAKVRLATLDVIDALVVMEDEAKGKGAGSEALLHLQGGRDANVVPIAAFYTRDTSINYYAKLVIDANPAVRLRFVHALGGWMTRLGDRHEWWPRLLPYVLSAFADPSAPVVAAAVEYLEACGVAHESEHGKLVLEKRQFGLDGDPEIDYGRALPEPFSSRANASASASARPRLGTRLFVRANCPRFLKPILAEIANWQPFGMPGGVDVRARAASLLCTVLVFLEEMATADVHALVTAVVATIHDRDIGSPHIRAAARLVGRFLPPSAWLDVLLPFLAGDAAIPHLRTGREDGDAGDGGAATDAESAAACLHFLWLAAAECRPGRLLPHIPRIVAALAASPRLLALAVPMHAADPLAASAAYTRRVGAGVDAVAAAAGGVCGSRGAGDANDDDGDGGGEGEDGGAAPHAADLPSTSPLASMAASALAKVRGAAAAGAAANTGSAPVDASSAAGFGGGAAGASGRAAVRSHLLASLSLVSLVLEGRLQSLAGANFESTGRLADPKAAMTALITCALTLRGHLAVDSVEGRGVWWGAGKEGGTAAASTSSSSSLPTFGYKRVGDAQSVYEGPVVGAEAGAAPVLHGDLVDALLGQLAKVAGGKSAARGTGAVAAGGPVGSASAPPSSPGAVGAVGAAGGAGGVPPLPSSSLPLLATRHNQLLLACLGDYPADAGWRVTSPQHALLTQLLLPPLALHVGAASPDTTLPLLVDLGRSLLAAAADLPVPQAPSTGAAAAAAAASAQLSGLLRRRGRWGLLPPPAPPRAVDLLAEWARVALPLLAAAASAAAAPTTTAAAAAAPPASLISSALELIGGVLCVDGAAASHPSFLPPFVPSWSPSGPHLALLACQGIAALAPILAFAASDPASAGPARTVASSRARSVVLSSLLPCAAEWQSGEAPPALRSLALRAAAALLPLALLEEEGEGGGGHTLWEQVGSVAVERLGDPSRRVREAACAVLEGAWGEAGGEGRGSGGAGATTLVSRVLTVVEALGARAGALSGMDMMGGDLEALATLTGGGAAAEEEGGGGGAFAAPSLPAHPSLPDRLLSVLMVLATHDPAAVAEAAQAFEGMPDGVAAEMAKALADHAGLLREFGRGRG